MTSRVTRSSTRQATQVVIDPTPNTKKAKVTFKDTPEIKTKTTEAANASKTIVIEHCKQCNQFKVRAVKVKLGLENALSGITVLVNPEKPRRGCFEVREEGGKKFVSLLDMKRPFAPMKALDMDALLSDIIEQIQ
ncbi:hypothetical protein QVD17_40547 [Tagetes erecta]|uniref:Selenoprotein H n=1 Tax=Tagetes erecta TaxID=13708 RepID=A0AAD8NHY0_TARER|nr:hypothetical protein QVD17_40547 [Tagetes erecta]